ncbi:trigger factor [Metamycoplasma subdolum]|uniref:Trigger factor n=1 Tax=Metamycoplasma subdolum TaxID=92407 RepID=A0A3L9ZYQ4_9BACT|nr:trigger factor [Metamycoplasma subdolum]RMA77507.1 trigger factor [Metamycoplasma subdolum]WPB50699.1 trigger factor [Metamycoplasma subdolum]
MSKTLLKKESLIRIEYVSEGEEWESALEKVRVELRKNITVKGYRKGHAPTREADKRIDIYELFNKAVDVIINKVYDDKIYKQLDVKKDRLFGQPDIKVISVSLDKLTLQFDFPVQPEVILGDYKKLKTKMPNFKLTSPDEEDAKQNLLARFMVTLDSEGPIKKGDIAIFDFIGKVNGEVFEHGSADDFELEIGSNTFIPGFEDQMIGLKKGETKDLVVTFPKDYHVDTLAGKPATFTVIIKQVKTKTYPEVNEDFVKQLNFPWIKSKKDFDEAVKLDATKNKLTSAVNEYVDTASIEVAKTSKMNINESLIHQEANRYMQDLVGKLKKQDVNLKEYLELTKTTAEGLEKQFAEQAKKNLSKIFTFGQIVADNKIELKDEEFDKEYQIFADLYNLPISTIKQYISTEKIADTLYRDKVAELLLKLNQPKVLEDYLKVKKEVEKFTKKQSETSKAFYEEMLKKSKEAKKETKEKK